MGRGSQWHCPGCRPSRVGLPVDACVCEQRRYPLPADSVQMRSPQGRGTGNGGRSEPEDLNPPSPVNLWGPRSVHWRGLLVSAAWPRYSGLAFHPLFFSSRPWLGHQGGQLQHPDMLVTKAVVYRETDHPRRRGQEATGEACGAQ